MIYSDDNSIDIVNQLLRKIRIKQTQLKLAQTYNMVYTSQVLQNQILELQHQLSGSQDQEINALMSLLDD